MLAAAKAKGVPMRIEEIGNTDAAKLYGRKLVLVRPDGHVAWRADTLPADCATLIEIIRGA